MKVADVIFVLTFSGPVSLTCEGPMHRRYFRYISARGLRVVQLRKEESNERPTVGNDAYERRDPQRV